MSTTLLLTLLCIILIIFIIFLNEYLKFNKLIKSDRYKNSNYVIQNYHNDYVLQNKTTGKYVCIEKPYAAEFNDFDSIYAKGSKSSVMKAFNQLVPIIF